MDNAFLEALKRRRTQYAIGRNLTLSHEQLIELIQEAVRHTPSAFNSQTSRVVILFGAQSEKLWDFTARELRKRVAGDAFAATQKKITAFAAGAGTVLFYEDLEAIEALQEKFRSYADNFPIWSEQASGMAQLSVWSTLANAGIGASLQHYNPLIDSAVAREWNIPAAWKLRAQMPFGSNEAAHGNKDFMDDAVRFRIHR